MMGVGKSTLAKIVSKRTDLKFIDTDLNIEKKFSMKISEIFKKKGENFFRKQEEKEVLESLKKNKCIIALGGGTFMNKNIRKEVLNNHTSIWLDLDNETIVKRINKSTKRPLALNSTREELLDMLKKRSYIYSKALFKVNCNNLTKIEIVKKIIKIYENNKS